MIRRIKTDQIRHNKWASVDLVEVNLTEGREIMNFIIAMIMTWILVLWALITWPKYLIRLCWQWRNSLPDARTNMWVEKGGQS